MTEQQRKAQSDKVDSVLEAQKLELEKTSLVVNAQKDKVKLDSALKADADKLDLEIFKTVTAPTNRK